jgi:hypothetical protein
VLRVNVTPGPDRSHALSQGRLLEALFSINTATFSRSEETKTVENFSFLSVAPVQSQSALRIFTRHSSLDTFCHSTFDTRPFCYCRAIAR